MNLEYLNKMVDYIEDNLENEIDFNELSNIANTNLFILERVFMFLTNMTIVEYIKKRRLSKAFEEIKNTDRRIIDIAFQFQYNSATSFNRAFKNLFGITPTECRKKIDYYQTIPIEHFEIKQQCPFNYQVKDIPEIKIYCYHISSDNHSDLLYKIRMLYKQVKDNGKYKKFNEVGMYGIFIKNKNQYHYYLGSKLKFPNLEEYIIPKGKNVVFELLSRDQNDIVNLDYNIKEKWIPSTNFQVQKHIKIECYLENKCYIYLPIK